MKKTLKELATYEKYFYYKTGKYNAITDVPGIKVGHATIIKGDNVRTGVTTVITEGIFEYDFAAGGFAFNANGEFTGLQYVFEEGKLYCPIFLTNTIYQGKCHFGLVVIDCISTHITQRNCICKKNRAI